MRLIGIDAPELRSKAPAEKAKGLENQAFVSQWFQQPGAGLVRTTKEEKVGRMLADLAFHPEESMAADPRERARTQALCWLLDELLNAEDDLLELVARPDYLPRTPQQLNNNGANTTT